MRDKVADEESRLSKSVARAADIWCSETVSDSEGDTAIRSYRSSVMRRIVFIGVCVAIAIVVAGLSLGMGTLEIGFLQSYEILINHILGVDPGTIVIDGVIFRYSLIDTIVWDERLPRIVMGLITGAGLAVGGCVMQSVLKNPLADPYTTGISSGAGFGATLALTAGFSLVAGSYGLVVNAFVFALIPMAVIILVSRMKSGSPTTMIMAGIAVMYIFNACSTVLKLMADPDDLSSLYSWQVGTLSGIEWEDVPIVVVVVAAGTVAVQILSRKINVLSTGDDSAKAMGVNVGRLRIGLLVIVSLMVAAIVSFTGLIGFIGLVAPHIGRIFVGSDNRYLVLSSAAFGAALLVLADLIGRSAIAGVSLQVGVITAFIGGPVFLYLIIRQRKSDW